MTVINQVMVEVVSLAVRGLDGTQTSIPQPPSPTPTPTDTAAATSSTAANNSNTANSTQSPLLFFVALGFGVVFTNLWIIVGVKYCFRYNARNRALARGEDGEPINLENMPRPHRRRREKKLMTMDEVNERFPLTKYKSWVAARASEGLPTAGGVAVSASRAASIREAEGVVPSSPVDTKHSTEERPTTAMSSAEAPEVIVSPPTNILGGSFGEGRKSLEATEKTPATSETLTMSPLAEIETAATADADKADDDDEDEDHIHDALPPELLTTPGDSCAICIDTIEDDDDIRGLTCGHAFHAGCLDPWLTSRRACCPLCKADYYVPKPRPEGEAAEAERPRRTGRMALPVPPGSAWTGIRGGPRMMFPGRGFMSHPLYASNRYHGGPGEDRRHRHGRRANTAQQAQSLEPVQDASAGQETAAPANRSLGERLAAWRPRLPGRSRGENNTTGQEVASPAPAQLESVVVH